MAIKDSKKAQQTTNTRDFEKASAFLNISLPSRDGKTTRLISVPLVESNKYHKGLIEYFAGAQGDDMVAKLENVKNRLVLDIGYSRSDDDSAFDL